MATRMTAAEKRAIAQAQAELRNAAEWAEFTSTYTRRLLDAALFFAATPSFRVRPLETGFYEFTAERSSLRSSTRSVIIQVNPGN